MWLHVHTKLKGSLFEDLVLLLLHCQSQFEVNFEAIVLLEAIWFIQGEMTFF